MRTVGQIRPIESTTGQNSQGFSRLLGTITGIDANGIALVVDQLGRQYQINTKSVLGSAPLPQLNEQWMIGRDNGYYTFQSRVKAILPVVDPRTPQGIVDALSQLGVITPATGLPDLPFISSTIGGGDSTNDGLVLIADSTVHGVGARLGLPLLNKLVSARNPSNDGLFIVSDSTQPSGANLDLPLLNKLVSERNPANDGLLVISDSTQPSGAKLAPLLSNQLSRVPSVLHTDYTTLTNSDLNKTHTCYLASSAFTVTLPSPVGISGQQICIKVTANSIQLLTLTTSGGNIDGLATRIMWAGESAILESDGSVWGKIGGLTKPMICSIQLTHSQNILATTKILFDFTLQDNTNLMSNTNRINILRSNTYTVTAQTFYASPSTTSKIGSIVYKNGNPTSILQSETDYPSGSPSSTHVLGPLSTQLGDFLDIYTYQGTGATQTLLTNLTNFSAVEVPSW